MDESATVTRRKSERYAKAEGLRAMGINPYPYKYNPTHTATTLLTLFSHLKPEEKTTQSVCIAGRLLNLRSMGKAAFAHVQDQSGKIQVYFREEDLGENALIFKKCDQGDIIGVVGTMFASKTGEITIYATQVTLLTKAVRDLPDKFHGIKDAELRYRQRYVDLFTHPSVRTVFEQRSKMFHAIREFLSEKGFIEVETPLLQTQYGGANARPFITHINAWNMPMFLSISPELYLKRLVVGGFEKVFTICKNFRNEGVDHSHNPEFTMLEAYFAYADYEDMMKLTEGLFEHACIAVHGKTQIPIQARDKDGKLYETTVDFKAPWPRVSVAQAIEQVCNIKVLTMSVEELKTFCHKEHVEISASATWGDCVSAIFDDLIEHTFVQPTHVYDKPKESSPLCKPHKTDSRLIEQCEPVGAGMELANMYSELNDPIVQRKLLEEQAQQLRAGNQEAQPMDEDFVKAIEYGMPPTGGLGIGLDRFAILLCNQSTIRDVILFPIVKPEHTKNAKPLP